MSESFQLSHILAATNSLLAAAVLIIAFSLLAYIALQNSQNDIARAMCVLLAAVVVVYAGDVLLERAENVVTINWLLRAQWIGIATVPAAYLHLSDALLSYSHRGSRRRRILAMSSYVLSALFCVLAVASDLVVRDELVGGSIPQLAPGPLFWPFALAFVAGALGALFNVLRTRRRALTPTLRRRMTYLALTFPAPALAVFPYLVVFGGSAAHTPMVILALSALGSVGVAAMVTVMAYSVGFQGLAVPDRLIKQDFIRWGLYGPLVGVTIILFLQIVPLIAEFFNLPSDTLITFGVMIMTVLMPLFISKVKPYLDALVYLQDHAEIDYLRALPRNTFTQADLRQLLENTLIVICGALEVDTGFVVGPGQQGHVVKSLIGSRRDVKRFVNEHALSEVLQRLESSPPRESERPPPPEAFLRYNGFLLLPLRSPDGAFLGALGVRPPVQHLSFETRQLVGALAHQIELALSTVQLQQTLFDTLRGLGPEMQSLQTLSSRLEQATPATLDAMDGEIALLPEFPQLVKDALGHYWGGSKLSDSPLLGLRTVRRSLAEHSGNPTRALQSVLRQAIENLRPNQQLDPSAQEWLLYNILELRFLQGKRVRDIADRLAMSESDFYRKQRIAVEEVARQLALMEEAEPDARSSSRG